MATKIVIDADVEKFIDSIDKASESIEYFAKTGNKAIDDVGDSYADMSEKQKRSFDASKKQFEDNVKKIKELEKEYENLRKKQKSGQQLTEDEFNRLKKINKEYKNYKGAVGQTSREMEKLAKATKKTVKGENDIKAKTPQVTHIMANLAAEVINVKTALLAAGGALASFGLDMENQVAHIKAMKGYIGDATHAFRALNEASLSTNFDATAMHEAGKTIIDLGYSAEEAAGIIGKLADAIAGIGYSGDTSKFEELVDVLKEIYSNGEFTTGHLDRLSEIGFTNIFHDIVKENGGNEADIYEQIVNNTYKGTQAFEEIVTSLGNKFEGAMEKSKDNVIDIWGDAMGDMQAGISELGSKLAEEFHLKDLVKWFADFMADFKVASQDFNRGSIGFFEYLDKVFGERTAEIMKWVAAITAAKAAISGLSHLKGLFGLGAGGGKEQKKMLEIMAYQGDSQMAGRLETLELLIGNMEHSKNSNAALMKKLEQAGKKASDEYRRAEEEYYSAISAGTDYVAEKRAVENRRKGYWSMFGGIDKSLLPEGVAAEARTGWFTFFDDLGDKADSFWGKYKATVKESLKATTKMHKEAVIEDYDHIKAMMEAGLEFKEPNFRKRTLKEHTSFKTRIKNMADKAKNMLESVTNAIRGIDLAGSIKGMGASMKNGAINSVGKIKEAVKTLKNIKYKEKIASGFANMSVAVANCATAFGGLKNAGIKLGSTLGGTVASGFTAVAGIVGTTLTPIIITATIAIKSLLDSLEDVEKHDYSALLETSMRGEDALDPDDPNDIINKAKFNVAKATNDARVRADIEASQKETEEQMKAWREKDNARQRREKAEREMAEKAALEAARQAREQQKNAATNSLKLYHQAAASELAQRLKLNEDKLASDIKYYKDLTGLVEKYGAKDVATERKIVEIGLAGREKLLQAEDDYQKKVLDFENQKEELSQAIGFADNVYEAQTLAHEIENINIQLAQLVENHKNDVIKIKIDSNIEEFKSKLEQKVNELTQNRAYEKDGEAGEISKFGNMMYNGLQAGTLTSFNKNSQALAEAQANGDAAGIMSIGQMLGLSVEEIQAKGEAIQNMYSVVQEAMVNATATEIDMNNQAFEAVNEHAENVKKLQDVVTDYCMGIANNFAGAFSDWVMGAKTAGQAIKDFAATLIQNIIQMAAQFAGLCAILAAFGVIPPGPVAAKMMFGYNSGHQYDAGSRGDKFMKKANGGYINGPGTSTSDSIPAMLSAGEYVLNARAVKAIGVGNLNMMNNAHTPRFAEGGLVGHNDAPAPAPVNNVTLQVSAVDATSFAGFLKRGGLGKIKQALFDDSRNFAAMDGVY